MNEPGPASHATTARFTLHVGILGHRPNNLDPRVVPALHDNMECTLERIGTALLAAWQRHAGPSAPEGGPQRRIVTSLAAGTDIIAGMVARSSRDIPLDIILPFDRDEFARDLDAEIAAYPAPVWPDWREEYDRLLAQAATVHELPTPADPAQQAQREAAYEAAGQMVVRTADIVLAVWDGRRKNARGGTSEMVRYAHETHTPVLRISPDGETIEPMDGPGETRQSRGDDVVSAGPQASPRPRDRAISAWIADTVDTWVAASKGRA